jgi:DNA-binding transcriptional regulator GbsR (MarR family)
LRARRLEQKVLRVCESAGAFIEYWGFKAIHGRVWTLLALHQGPLHQKEIAAKLGVSRSLLSSTISELQEFGLVRPVDARRNSPYRAALDVWPTITEVLRTREWVLLESARVALEAAIEEADLRDPLLELPVYDVKTMQLLLKMTESAQGFLRIIVTMRMPKAAEGLGVWVGRAQVLLAGLRGPVTSIRSRLTGKVPPASDIIRWNY